MARAWAASVLAIAIAFSGAGRAATPRVFSLDQCADQYVLALSPRGAIVGLSPRAADADSYLRAAAAGLPRRRASPEAILAARPDVVVTYWGGDQALLRHLQARGVRIARIDEAVDFAGVRADVRRVAAALGQPARGEALIAGMDAELAGARGVFRGDILYLTPSGVTAGEGTLVDAMITAAGYRNDAPGPGYRSVSVERVMLNPPAAFATGFFDAGGLSRQHWAVAAGPALRDLLRRRTTIALSAAVLGCPAWFAADAVRVLATARPPR